MRSWFIEMRKKANLTQQNVADKIGVTRQMISAIENGEAEPSVTTAKALGNLLGLQSFLGCFFYAPKLEGR